MFVFDDLDEKNTKMIRNFRSLLFSDSVSRRVTVEIVDEVVDASRGKVSVGDVTEVIDAFSVPRVIYDAINKLFYRDTQPRHLFGDAQSKVQLYVDRFMMIQQRLRRHKLFRPTKWSHLMPNRSQEVAELTELKALLGCVGERRYVMGFLTRQDEDRYYIEDLSARLPLDLDGAETTDGMFPENSIVVAEGDLTPSGKFRAFALGLPPAEPRADSLSALQGLDVFGGNKKEMSAEEMKVWEEKYEGDRVIILSEVFLDRMEVMDKLRTIFDGYSSIGMVPSAFVMMGNFQSYNATSSATNYPRQKENFTNLGRLIARYPELVQHSKFILVPGPGDVGPNGTLPRPGLPNSIVQPLLDLVPGVVLASNPCRLRFGPRELVLFRFNSQRIMKGLCLLPYTMRNDNILMDETESEAGMKERNLNPFDQVCATVLQEGHLCPIPLEYQPILWEWDHSLWVYPLPHGLVLADSEPAARSRFDTCSCLNPGSLISGSFGAWNPVENEMEICDVAMSEAQSSSESEDVPEEQQEEEVEEEAVRELNNINNNNNFNIESDEILLKENAPNSWEINI